MAEYVYVAFCNLFDGCGADIIGVFSSEEKAAQWVESLSGWKRDDCEECEALGWFGPNNEYIDMEKWPVDDIGLASRLLSWKENQCS